MKQAFIHRHKAKNLQRFKNKNTVMILLRLHIDSIGYSRNIFSIEDNIVEKSINT